MDRNDSISSLSSLTSFLLGGIVALVTVYPTNKNNVADFKQCLQIPNNNIKILYVFILKRQKITIVKKNDYIKKMFTDDARRTRKSI